MNEAQARTSDPETSHEAAEQVSVARLERLFVKGLVDHGPQTSDQMAHLLGLPLNSISPRTRPLGNKRQIRDSGQRRQTRTGRRAIVWELTNG